MKRLTLRLRGWTLLALSLLLGALASFISAEWIGRPIAFAAASILTAGAAFALSRGQEWLKSSSERKALLMQQLLTVHERGKPYRLRELVDPVALRVHPAIDMRGSSAESINTAKRTPAYLPRDADERLRLLLRKERFVLVIGESTAGKTRSAYEAVRALYPDHYLIAPVDRKSLQACLPVILEHHRAVLWLDDLERFLGSEGLTASYVNRVLGGEKRRAIVVATIRTSEHDRYALRAESELVGNERESWYAARDVIALATTIELQRLWSRSELNQAQMFVDDERIRSALRLADRFGVAEVLAAAPELVNDWRSAWRPGAHPRGAALVAAAVDCRRAGVHEPLAHQFLSSLANKYIETRGGALLRPETEDEAIAWATSLSNGASSLLMPTNRPNHYIAFDYLIDLPAELGIPIFIWKELLSAASPAEAFNIGESAFYRFRYDIAVEAYRKAVQGQIPHSEVALASAIGEVGDPEMAVRMLAAVMADWSGVYTGDELKFRVRHQYAYYSACAGNLRDATSMFELLAEDQKRVLGNFHKDTLASRHRHAFYTAEVGDNAEAVKLFSSLLQAQSEHLGPLHPDTLATRHELGYSLGRAGSVRLAVETLTELLSDRRRVFGPDDPRVYQTRHVLSRFVGWNGEPQTAAEMFEQLAEDWQALLQPGHQHVLLARYERIYFMAQAGRTDDAAALLLEFIEDRDRSLGFNGSVEKFADDFLSNIIFGWPPHARYPRQEFVGAGVLCAALLGQANPYVAAIESALRDRLTSP